MFKTIAILKRVELALKAWRCQGYDGASNIIGCRSGLSTRVKELSSLPIFIHWCNHRLNVVVQNIGKNVPEY